MSCPLPLCAEGYIHGNLIQIHDQGVLILGPPGSGKSSLSFQYLTQGHRLISDDVVKLIFLPREKKLIGKNPTNAFRLHHPSLGFLVIDDHFPGQTQPSTEITHCLWRSNRPFFFALTPMDQSLQNYLDRLPQWTQHNTQQN